MSYVMLSIARGPVPCNTLLRSTCLPFLYHGTAHQIEQPAGAAVRTVTLDEKCCP